MNTPGNISKPKPRAVDNRQPENRELNSVKTGSGDSLDKNKTTADNIAKQLLNAAFEKESALSLFSKTIQKNTSGKITDTDEKNIKDATLKYLSEIERSDRSINAGIFQLGSAVDPKIRLQPNEKSKAIILGDGVGRILEHVECEVRKNFSGRKEEEVTKIVEQYKNLVLKNATSVDRSLQAGPSNSVHSSSQETENPKLMRELMRERAAKAAMARAHQAEQNRKKSK